MKKGYYVLIGLLVIILGVFLYLHFKTEKVSLDESIAKSESPIDLRPLIISKLQKMVSEGSDGLYKLQIEKIEPDVLAARIDVINAVLIPDSAVLKILDERKQAPDDVYKIKLGNLHIAGLGPADFINKDDIDIDTLYFSRPDIIVYHEPRNYNALERKLNDSLTLYQKLTKNFKSFHADAIVIDNGTYTNHNLSKKNKSTKLENVGITLSNLTIDASTQYDKNRFLFSKEAQLSAGNYSYRTPDSLYFFTVKKVQFIHSQKKLIAREVALKPRYGKDQFMKIVKDRTNRMDLKINEIICNDIDWLKFVNDDELIASSAVLNGGMLDDYLDRSQPVPQDFTYKNFPGQAILKLPTKINISVVQVKNFNIHYEEFNPLSKQTGEIVFTGLQGEMKNVTNMPYVIKKNKYMAFDGSMNFMKVAQVNIHLKFDLTKPETGDFTAKVTTGSIGKELINPVAEPLGLFSIKSGEVNSSSSTIAGNNYRSNTSVTLLYKDLKITPLKNADGSGELKNKAITGFVANTFLIKNNNPHPGEKERIAKLTVERKTKGSFYNFLWKSMLTGILETIGLPTKMAQQE